jgi:uncharacterized protein (PEP-CTERM system associated)
LIPAALDANTRQTGADLVWNWRLTPFTSANFNTMYLRSQVGTTDVQQITKLARATLSRRFRQDVDGMVEFRRQMLDSNGATGSYVENALSAYVSMRF